MPVDAREFKLVRYSFGQSQRTAGDPETIETLMVGIREALDTEPEGSAASHAPMKKTPKERRYELAERIEATAEAIRLLRSNTTRLMTQPIMSPSCAPSTSRRM